ncbi:MAG TPA: aldehyde dehydrogenase family protein [Pseudorhodoferax sp.]|nr:aldehyde dehydrogenase family protein [Pseudorhodoferax sp.]
MSTASSTTPRVGAPDGPVTAFIDGQRCAAGGAQFLFAPAAAPQAGYAIAETSAEQVDAAVQAAHRRFMATRPSALADRIDILERLATAIATESETLAALISHDVGKPIRVARGEVGRGLEFVRACTAAAGQIGGEVIPVDAVRPGVGRFGFTRRVPYGVVGAITPFNAPINLLVQKLAPALAAGNTVVAKPAPPATRTALHLAEALVRQGVAPGVFNVVTGDRAAATALAAHPRVPVVSFTGGVAAAESLLRHTGVRKFVSELGSSAANIVLADADLDSAAQKIAGAAFEASGQQCISAQRVIVDRRVYPAFVERFVAAALALRVGRPEDEDCSIGPMVSQASADRVMALCEDALRHGARALLPIVREGLTVHPLVLADLAPAARLWHEEVFGPVAVLLAADDAEHALRLANDSPFGLQGALFTRDLGQIFRFADEFDVGSMWVNEASRFRLDMYPFGGMKHSGVGREGVRYAIEELSQLKFTGIHWRA